MLVEHWNGRVESRLIEPVVDPTVTPSQLVRQGMRKHVEDARQTGRWFRGVLDRVSDPVMRRGARVK